MNSLTQPKTATTDPGSDKEMQTKTPGFVTQTLAIASFELRLLLRSKSTLISATLFPLALAAMIIFQRDSALSAGTTILLFSTVMFAVMTVYVSLTTTLVTRRQELYLKRLRSGEASDVAILAGMMMPILGIGLGQWVIILVASFAIGVELPVNMWFALIAVVGIYAANVAAAFATAAVTPNPSAAQISVMPFLLVVIGTMMAAGVWESQYWDLTPGGAVVTLSRLANGVETPGLWWTAAAGLVLWTYAGYWISKKTFRWEPRS